MIFLMVATSLFSMSAVFRVIADKQEPEKFKFIHDGLVKEYIPMFI